MELTEVQLTVSPSRRSDPRTAVLALTALLAALATTVLLVLRDAPAPPGDAAWAALPFLVVLLAAAERLDVRFRYGAEVDTWNLMEAVLAPTLFAFRGPIVMAAVAVAQLAGGVARRNAPLKIAFNSVQWVLAAGAGSLVLAHLAVDQSIASRTGVLVAVLGVVALLNQAAMTAVLAIVNRHSPRRVVARVTTDLFPGWLVGWLANVLIGVLFVLAYDTHAIAVLLFPVPLVALHLAYRAAARARADRHRQTGVHEAIRVLTDPLDPADGIGAFLRAVAVAFDAASASFVVVEGGRSIVHRMDEDGVPHTSTTDAPDSSVERAVVAAGGAGIVTPATADRDPVARAAGDAGWRECLFAVCETDAGLAAVVIRDREGLEGSHGSEVVLVEGLVREAASALEKGRLVEEVVEEQRKLAAIVESTSDGIATISDDGLVQSWNAALEAITGLGADSVIGRRGIFVRLQTRSIAGVPVDLARWARGVVLPEELRVTGTDGEPRRLSCSYSRAVDERSGRATLVVIARDITPAEEMEALRAQFGRLAEVEAVHREVVDQLQQAVMPPAPTVAGAELAVRYVSSHPAAPTGGDLYDWHVLPTGEIHLAVIDVLGHGVEATRAALAVIHALRVLALRGCALDELVAEADALLATDPELVATVVVGRYQPTTGSIALAGGGHPNPLVVTPHDGVHELELGGGAIGWPNAGSRAASELRLGLGEAIVLYTDGVVEARKDILEGTRRLVDCADRLAHLPAGELAVRLLDGSLAGAVRRDDSLLLVLRRVGAEPVRTWTIAPEAESVGVVRRQLVAWLEAHPVPQERLDAVALVVSELVTNAVTAARSTIQVHAVLGDATLEVAVTDDGRGLTVHLDDVPDVDDLFAESGRGLHLVDALASTWTVRADDAGTTVRAQLALGDGRSVPPVYGHPAGNLTLRASPTSDHHV
jgi:PAS domain S-box-containing protein